MWSGTVMVHVSRARPALAGKYKASGPSDKKVIVEGTLERGPSGFAHKGLEELCLVTGCA